MTTHDFTTSYTNSQGFDHVVEYVCKEYFGGTFAQYVRNTDVELDKKGIDATVTLRCGNQRFIDYKIDNYDTDIIALEIFSDIGSRKPGWSTATTKVTDYIVFVKNHKTYALIFPFSAMQSLLRKDFLNNYKDNEHRLREVRNKSYSTQIALYTVEELVAALGTVIKVDTTLCPS